MATLAASQCNFNFGLLNFDGFPVEVYRVQSGGADGDTVAIAPNRFDLVKAAIAGGPAVHNLSAPDAVATNVTFTIKNGGITNTVTSFDVIIIGAQRQ